MLNSMRVSLLFFRFSIRVLLTSCWITFQPFASFPRPSHGNNKSGEKTILTHVVCHYIIHSFLIFWPKGKQFEGCVRLVLVMSAPVVLPPGGLLWLTLYFIIFFSLFITFYHFLSPLITFYHFLSLFITFYHFSSLFITFYHLLSLFITFYHFLSLFITFYHCLVSLSFFDRFSLSVRVVYIYIYAFTCLGPRLVRSFPSWFPSIPLNAPWNPSISLKISYFPSCDRCVPLWLWYHPHVTSTHPASAPVWPGRP
jgi:hypothetical protein